MAVAIGADLKKRANGKIATLQKQEYMLRIDRARDLCTAISETRPDDARQILTAALVDLCAGFPLPSLMEDHREDARWWAALSRKAAAHHAIAAPVWAK
ncbi:hypothetical protein [Pontitalea aquivivens]|uniref:hypothetical protein n=1 Tax=Pontitalea aquivivens TaxID=3388663 RepID=UPI003970AF87